MNITPVPPTLHQPRAKPSPSGRQRRAAEAGTDPGLPDDLAYLRKLADLTLREAGYQERNQSDLFNGSLAAKAPALGWALLATIPVVSAAAELAREAAAGRITLGAYDLQIVEAYQRYRQIVRLARQDKRVLKMLQEASGRPTNPPSTQE